MRFHWFGLVALGACMPMRVPVPAPLADAPEWVVRTGGWRADRLRFGPFEAHRIDREVRRRGGILDAVSGKRETQQEYEFLLRDTASTEDLWKVSCDQRDVERAVGLRGVNVQLDDRRSLDCRFQAAGDSAPEWRLSMGTRGDRMPAGELRLDSTRYQVQALNPGGESGCCEIAGYLVRADGGPLVLVDRADRGRVRLSSVVTDRERPLLAALAAALLIREDLRE